MSPTFRRFSRFAQQWFVNTAVACCLVAVLTAAIMEIGSRRHVVELQQAREELHDTKQQIEGLSRRVVQLEKPKAEYAKAFRRLRESVVVVGVR